MNQYEKIISDFVETIKNMTISSKDMSKQKRIGLMCLLISVLQVKLDLVPSEWRKYWDMDSIN